MVTYFNKKDLVNFGKYLLSEERTAKIKATSINVPFKERVNKVYHADIENFLFLNKKKP